MANETREILLGAGSALFLERGYSATGLQDVLERAGVPKGSFYHHFGSKETFGLELVERAAAAGLAELDAAVSTEGLPHLERLRRHFAAAGAALEGEGCCRGGCLMGSLGQELANVSEPIRERVAATFERWQRRIAGCLERARDEGELPPDADPARLAAYLLMAWEGALQQMRIRRSGEPIAVFLEITFKGLLGHTAAS